MENNELYHWGIKGMRWGRRRYQNQDGSLTPEGRKRYSDPDEVYEQGREDAKREIAESRKKKIKTAINIGAAAAIAAVAIVGTKKYIDSKSSNKAIIDSGKSSVEKILNKNGGDKSKLDWKKIKDLIVPIETHARSKDNMTTVNKPLWEKKSNLSKTLGESSTMRTSNKPSWQKHDGMEDGESFDELEHSGIKGMKWGIRRFQNKDGSLTPEGRKRYADDDNDSMSEEVKKFRAEAKDRAIKSGDVERVARWREEMTNDEFRKALDRVDLERRMDKLSATTQQTGFEKAMSAADKLDKIQKAGGTLVNTYNLVAKINNTWNKKFQLPGITDERIKIVDAYAQKIKERKDDIDIKIQEERLKQERSKTAMNRHNLRQAKKKSAAKNN